MDLLECPVCLDTYQEPVLLPACGHTFCRRCVERIVASTTTAAPTWVGGHQYKCPTCRCPFRPTEPRPNYALRQLLADRNQNGSTSATSHEQLDRELLLAGQGPTMTNGNTTSSPQHLVAHHHHHHHHHHLTTLQPSSPPPTNSSPGCSGLRRGLTRYLGGAGAQPDLGRIQALQDLGVPYGLAKLLDEEDRQIGMRIFLLDNSGSTSGYDGHYFEYQPNGTLISRPCSRWEEIKRMALEQAEWNITVGTPCEFILLNPGPGPLQEGRDFMRINDQVTPAMRINSGHQSQQQAVLGRLRSMLDASGPSGFTPIADRLGEIYQRINGVSAELAGCGQRIVLVIATDGLPTSNLNGQCTEAEKRRMVQSLVHLMSELSVFVVIRLTTDDDSVINYYNDLDEELEWPLEVLDDIESEAREIRQKGNGWLTYSPLLHKIREGGTFVKLFDLLDERCFTPTELSLMAQLLLRSPGDAPMPRSAEDFYYELEETVDQAHLVYDPLRRCMAPPIDVSKAWWVVMPPRAQMSQMIRAFVGPLSVLGPCTHPASHVSRTELVF